MSVAFIPVGKRAYLDGTAEWIPEPHDGAARAAFEAARDLHNTYSCITCLDLLETRYNIEIVTDNLGLSRDITRYFKVNQENLPVTAAPTNAKQIQIVYMTKTRPSINGVTVGNSSMPYQGVYEDNGQYFAVGGKVSLGTLKSVVIGAASGVALSIAPYLPLHSSIIAAPNGNAVAISGRGNTGKTTNLVAAFQTLRPHGFSVVTDDWSLVSEESLHRITPVDMLVGVRPEAVEGIVAACDYAPLSETQRNLLHAAAKDACGMTSVRDVYGCSPVLAPVLKAVIFTDQRPAENGESYYITDDLPFKPGRRLRDDAYHAPNISNEALDPRYDRLIDGLRLARIYTKLAHSCRSEQAKAIAGWIMEAVK